MHPLLDRLQGAIDGFKRGRAAAEKTAAQQAAWNQTVSNAAQQTDGRRIYLERESNALREMAKDLTRALLRYKNNVKTNDGSYPSDRLLGFDGYQTTLDYVAAEQTLKKRGGAERKPSWRDRFKAEGGVIYDAALTDAEVEAMVPGVRPLS